MVSGLDCLSLSSGGNGSSDGAVTHYREALERARRRISSLEIAEPLSARERDILEALCAGMTDREISGALYLSERTVKMHIVNIYNKLGISFMSGNKRVIVAAYARQHYAEMAQ